MNKKKKSKIDIIFERSAKEYADKIIQQAVEQSRINRIPLTDKSLKSMRNLIESSYIAGECHMYGMLITNMQTQKRAK